MSNGKGPRFAAAAIRHYITVLEDARWHFAADDDDQGVIDNDIGLYKAILSILERDEWPRNNKDVS